MTLRAMHYRTTVNNPIEFTHTAPIQHDNTRLGRRDMHSERGSGAGGIIMTIPAGMVLGAGIGALCTTLCDIAIGVIRKVSEHAIMSSFANVGPVAVIGATIGAVALPVIVIYMLTKEYRQRREQEQRTAT